jgi:hypothetical protein
MAAARAVLDQEHGPMPSQDAQDRNNYVLGHVHSHNVMIACLPAGVDGTNAAAFVAANMLRAFEGLRFGLMVGIGGGIRLGDVVVSQPDKTHGGVVQYDKGKSLDGGEFERKGSLNKPPSLLRQRMRYSMRACTNAGDRTEGGRKGIVRRQMTKPIRFATGIPV